MQTPSSGTWVKQVLVEIELEDETAVLHVINTREAAVCLMSLWPHSRGPAFVEAVRACNAAIDGKADDESARDAFLAAAVEAEIAVPIH